MKMKKLSKLNINPEKVMKNTELTTLRGGTDPGTGNCCMCYGGFPIEQKGYILLVTKEQCNGACEDAGWFYGLWLCLV